MNSPPLDGLRERKKRDTEARIRETALELCLKHGYEHTRIEDIAAAADVSPRTLFRYFANKEEIFVLNDEEILAALRHTVENRKRGTSLVDAIRVYAERVADEHVKRKVFFVKRHKLLKATPQLARHASAYRPRFVEALTHAMRDHARVKPRRLRIVMGALEGAIDAAREEWLDHDGEGSLHTLWREVIDTLEPVLSAALKS